MRRRPRTEAFTLVEVALAIVIVGVGSVALMELAATCTAQNRAAAEMTTAAMLAQHVQEMLADLPLSDPAAGPTTFGKETGETLTTFDDLDDFNDQTFSPPIDSGRAAIANAAGYAQRVTVLPVSGRRPSGIDLARTAASYTGAVRVRVQVTRTTTGLAPPTRVYELEWVRVEE